MYDFVACDSIKTVGTCFQGTVKTTFDKIVEVFGVPTFTDASPYEKVNAEWSVKAKDKDNTVFTIYNWKDGFIPTDEYENFVINYNCDTYDYKCICTRL